MRRRAELALGILTGVLATGCGSGKSLPGSGGPGGLGGRGAAGANGGAGAKGGAAGGAGGTAGSSPRGGAAGSAGASGSAGAAGTAGRGGGPGGAVGGTIQVEVPGQVNNDLDLLFMIDNSSSMTVMQQKLMLRIPSFIQALQQLPTGLPNLHIAVLSSDLGAPSDAASSVGCPPEGDKGEFQSLPQGSCTATTLTAGATFVSETKGQMNSTSSIDQVVQCLGLLGATGCGFEHQLASIDRALGADGAPAPASNAGFLRSSAYLGIILLTNEDDCSAPPNTTIYSLNGGMQNISNPDGPLARYRCNGGPRGGHLCQDPATGQLLVPPLDPPASATGSPPILNLTNCRDNDTGTSALTPVSTFVQHIKAVKPDPDNQILVATIATPPAPYAVEWVPPISPPPGAAGQPWPKVMHACGPRGGSDVNPQETQGTTDGSFGDPAVRINQFVNAFPYSVVASICDPSYQNILAAIASRLGALIIRPSCLQLPIIQNDIHGDPSCTVTTHVRDGAGKQTDLPVPNCGENGGAAPCWTMTINGGCPAGSVILNVMPDQAIRDAASFSTTFTCSVCQPGSGMPGC